MKVLIFICLLSFVYLIKTPIGVEQTQQYKILKDNKASEKIIGLFKEIREMTLFVSSIDGNISNELYSNRRINIDSLQKSISELKGKAEREAGMSYHVKNVIDQEFSLLNGIMKDLLSDVDKHNDDQYSSAKVIFIEYKNSRSSTSIETSQV